MIISYFMWLLRFQKKHILKNRSNFGIPPSENKSIQIEMVLKGNSENENYVINYHVSPNPFIFGTPFTIFVMKSESFLTLHREQCIFHV